MSFSPEENSLYVFLFSICILRQTSQTQLSLDGLPYRNKIFEIRSAKVCINLHKKLSSNTCVWQKHVSSKNRNERCFDFKREESCLDFKHTLLETLKVHFFYFILTGRLLNESLMVCWSKYGLMISLPSPIGSMYGITYIYHKKTTINVGKYTVRPMDPSWVLNVSILPECCDVGCRSTLALTQ